MWQDNTGDFEVPDFICFKGPEEEDDHDQVDQDDHKVSFPKEIMLHHAIKLPDPKFPKNEYDNDSDQAAGKFYI